MQRNSHLTFRGNSGIARHDWLRLTPAYSRELVARELSHAPMWAEILDPFSGTGTTGVTAAELGLRCTLLDINPFLVWLSNAKSHTYAAQDIQEATAKAATIADCAPRMTFVSSNLPPIYAIERWWSSEKAAALARIRGALALVEDDSAASDLLRIAFCRTMIQCSNAAFNHQSMSFKKASEIPTLFNAIPIENLVLRDFIGEVDNIVASAQRQLPGNANARIDDARSMSTLRDGSVDLLYTSPPYANRMSYMRELRPYMYWLGYIRDAREVGELDWQAIGGTWGIATSRVAVWESPGHIPLGNLFRDSLERIASNEAKHAPLLARYVHKYFYDMWRHFQAAFRVLRPGGRAIYIVGNSSFYHVPIPTEVWYSELLNAAGFVGIRTRPLRKRNSKKELVEFEITAEKH